MFIWLALQIGRNLNSSDPSQSRVQAERIEFIDRAWTLSAVILARQRHGLPWPISTSICRSFGTICSGVNVFFGMFPGTFLSSSLYPTGTEIPGQVSSPWPCQKPPWGRLTAVNTATGDFAWQIPLGVTEGLPDTMQN